MVDACGSDYGGSLVCYRHSVNSVYSTVAL